MPPTLRARGITAQSTAIASSKKRGTQSTKRLERASRPITRSISRAADHRDLNSDLVFGSNPTGTTIRAPKPLSSARKKAPSAVAPKRSGSKNKQQIKATSKQISQPRSPNSKTKGKPGATRDIVDKPVPRVSPEVVQVAPSRTKKVQAWAAQVTQEVVPEVPIVSEASYSDSLAEPAIWWRRWGYSPPDEQEMALASVGGPEDSMMTSKGGMKKRKDYITVRATEEEFVNGLRERGITLKPERDEDIEAIKELVLAEWPMKPTQEDETNWKTDLLKCGTCDEALFQRTIMMEILDRYKLGDHLDYTCESAWTCASMPRRNGDGRYRLAKPKPDIAVSFKLDAVMSEADIPMLGVLRGCMCPESSKKEGSNDRAFTFFSMEVKDSQAKPGEPIANRQNFNTASQALFNIYQFMKKAGREEIFLEKVRFYSAVATPASCYIRVHRAVRVEKRRQISDDYPLGYRFDNVFQSQQKHYTRAEVTGAVKNILFEYGVKILLPILKDAVNEALLKLDDEEQLKASIGKRRAEEVLESFTGSSRMRLGSMDLADATESQGSQPVLAS
ncbi:hypothetical protein MMC13_002543 [Lambiella insularis]|nr:hypothetical protein [Lambiella insularis]